jgi:two-component system, sensor histidine kinase YesM
MIRKDSIFNRLLWINGLYISLICFILTILSINISKTIIVNQAIKNLNKNYEYIQKDLVDYNFEIIQALTKISKSDVFKEYLSEPIDDTVKQFNMVVSLGEYMESNREYLTPKNSHIVAVGNNSMYYSTNSLHWDIELKDVFDSLDLKGDSNNIGYKIADTFNIKSVKYKNSLLAIKPLIDKNNKSEVYGHMYLVIDERAIYNMYEKYLSDGMTFILISSDGQVMSSNDTDKITTYDYDLLEQCKSNEDGNLMKIKKGYSTHTLVSNYIPFFDAYFVADINHSSVSDSLNSLIYYMVIIIAIILLLIIITTYIVSYRFSKPLLSLVDLMSKGTLEPIIRGENKTNKTYEIRVLTNAYDNMIEKIDYYVKNLISEEEERRKAELNALQMQINPHFLYNTLSTIKYLARSEKINEVDKTIDALISILRNTIGTTEEMATIESEIKSLEQYVYINKLRFGSATNVAFRVSNECNEILIPKLIIQPFIENAFFHAFAGKIQGEIDIFINKSGNFVIIEIIDNGVGMEVTDINKIKRKKLKGGIGIKNVDERIKLIYGEEFGVKIVSEKGYGTIVSIKIPINKSDK